MEVSAMQPSFELTPAVDNDDQREHVVRKMSAARLFRPDTHGFDEQRMLDSVTPAQMAAAWPDKFYPHLVGPAVRVSYEDNGQGRQAVSFMSQQGNIKVALAGHERLKYGYNLEALAEKVAIKAKDAAGGKYAEGDVGAPARASIHAVEERVDVMRQYRGTLTSQKTLLQKFIEALEPKHIGLARMGSEEAMKNAFDTLTHVIITDMLNAVDDQKNWGPELYGIAEHTVLTRMLADRVKNRHLAYTHRLSRMLLAHNSYKTIAFNKKIERGERYIVERSPKVIT